MQGNPTLPTLTQKIFWEKMTGKEEGFSKPEFLAAHKCTIYNGVLTSLIFSCSGTLSYIFNNFIGSRTFSEVVAEAKQAGYTEPDPRDDLSGTDVRRKVQSGQSLHDIVT